MNDLQGKIKPFVKWAGGKSQLINDLRLKYPTELGKSIKKYAEPFVGSGAVLFDILNSYVMDEIYISDINEELINSYQNIKCNVDDLIIELSKLEATFIPLDKEDRKTMFYENRRLFNELKERRENQTSITRSALFIFLNKTCFNGLYRVNRKGQFNVPMGSYAKPLICDENNLRNISDKFKNIEIVWGDYRLSENFIDDKTFVYFDPPYRPLTNTSSFTAYAETVFNDKSQFELAEFVCKMNERNAKIALSNSDPKNIDINDNFFDTLYSKFEIERVLATRMINSNGSSRGKISELLISNI